MNKLLNGLLVGLFLSGLVFADSTGEKKLLTCTQLGQDDILQVALVQRDTETVMILTEKDGEIETAVKVPADIEELSLVLPNWKGESRTLRREGSFWIISSCGGSMCTSTKINCN